MKKYFAASSALMFLLAFAPAALAQAPEWTPWTIDQPTRVGEKVLQPGTYRVIAQQAPVGRTSIRVMTEDGTTHLVTALAIPRYIGAEGQVPDDGARFVYYDAFDGEPQVLRTWYAMTPPGAIAHDFVYDEDFGLRLARAANAPVVTYRDMVAETDFGTAELHVVTPDAKVETWTAPEPRTTIVETRPVVTETRTMNEERTELPETSGRTPLFALLGLVAIAGAVAFRFMNR
jgi:hypothetical protein